VILASCAIGCGSPGDSGPKTKPPAPGADLGLDLGADLAAPSSHFPVLLVHGFSGSPTNWISFYKVQDALMADGRQTFVADLPPYDTVAVRAAQLTHDIDRALAASGAKAVNIIAHSMGGLDARYAAARLGYASRIASVTTVSAPHGGTEVADLALSLVPGVATGAADALATVIGTTFSDVASDSHVRAGIADLTLSNAARFNAEVPDQPGVYYQSYAGVATLTGLWSGAIDDACRGADGTPKLLMPEGVIGPVNPVMDVTSVLAGEDLSRLPNDGFIAVLRARWGTFQGCIPADHLEEVGQVERDGPDPVTGWDHVQFYRRVVSDLAAKGL
jgi:triacylglycerol lipase